MAHVVSAKYGSIRTICDCVKQTLNSCYVIIIIIYKVSHYCMCVCVCRLTPREFNSYGARRGNDSVMARGTFANIRLVNKFMKKPGPKTLHFPSGIYTNTLYTASIY